MVKDILDFLMDKFQFFVSPGDLDLQLRSGNAPTTG